MCEEDPVMVQEMESSLGRYNESTGEILDENLVKIGEQEEMARFPKMGAYSHVCREDSLKDDERKFGKVKWARINEGTKDNPKDQVPLRCSGVGLRIQGGRVFCRYSANDCCKVDLGKDGEQSTQGHDVDGIGR